jgi:hypothetical protein
MKHTLSLDNMLEEKKVLLAEQKRDLKVWETALVEAQSRGLNPLVNWTCCQSWLSSDSAWVGLRRTTSLRPRSWEHW